SCRGMHKDLCREEIRRSIGRRLTWALDAVSFAEDRLNFVADPWQRRLLRSRAPAVMLNCCRQNGKSTTAAIVALHQSRLRSRINSVRLAVAETIARVIL